MNAQELHLRSLVAAGLEVADCTGFTIGDVERRIEELAEAVMGYLLWQRDTEPLSGQERERVERIGGSTDPSSVDHLCEWAGRLFRSMRPVGALAIRFEAACPQSGEAVSVEPGPPEEAFQAPPSNPGEGPAQAVVDPLDSLSLACDEAESALPGAPGATFGDDWWPQGVIGHLWESHVNVAHRLNCVPLELPPGAITAERASSMLSALRRWISERRACPADGFERLRARIRHERILASNGSSLGSNFDWQAGVNRLWQLWRGEFPTIPPPPRPARCGSYEEASDAVDALQAALEQAEARRASGQGITPAQRILDRIAAVQRERAEAEAARQEEEARRRPFRELRTRWDAAWRAFFAWPAEQNRLGARPSPTGCEAWARLAAVAGATVNEYDALRQGRLLSCLGHAECSPLPQGLADAIQFLRLFTSGSLTETATVLAAAIEERTIGASLRWLPYILDNLWQPEPDERGLVRVAEPPDGVSHAEYRQAEVAFGWGFQPEDAPGSGLDVLGEANRRSDPSADQARTAHPDRLAQPTPAVILAELASASGLAMHLGQPVDRVEVFLRRFRADHPDCYIENDSRRKKESRYLYRVSDVLPPLQAQAEIWRLKGRQSTDD